ncbi:amidohydrolase family protein [Streptomyces sp. NBC_00878]|uniref:amidohydrolase family protein n=1 Tax=Streptomyces sp. NBC_00878 TaxID=2975854 RepID=UPI00225186C8|nr:amidohydrolase family protein [Streptomyces sp. NBC_00878]MCX4909023.1 amidohydrolase [Streptomyces sp. NBC_00878]
MTRIDVHQHLIPPGYVDTLKDHGVLTSGGRGFPGWNAAGALDFMDRNAIGVGILSLSAPGVWVGDPAQSLRLARTVNDYGAELAKDRPDRFGQFACLPLPDVDASMAEAVRALDELQADGVVVLANNDGVYFGDPRFDPLMDELDRRGAVVLLHPNALPGPAVSGIPAFAVDFLLDTTRATVNLLLNDIPNRYPRLKIILSHAGGFTPYASHRIAALTVAHDFQTALGRPRRSQEELLETLAGFYFDTALSASPASLPSLLAFATPGHVLFGSDYPYPPEPTIAHFTAGLDAYGDLDADSLAAVNETNAHALFPRLAAAAMTGR